MLNSPVSASSWLEIQFIFIFNREWQSLSRQNSMEFQPEMFNFYYAATAFASMQMLCRWHELRGENNMEKFNSGLNALKKRKNKTQFDLWTDVENSLPFSSRQHQCGVGVEARENESPRKVLHIDLRWWRKNFKIRLEPKDKEKSVGGEKVL